MMNRYAVFAKKTIEAQAEGDTTIWHFLNDTTDRNEAFFWYMAAKNNDDYREVQIVEPIELKVEVL